MVFVLAHAAALSDLHSHGTTDHITRRKVLGRGGIALHESLSLRVSEDAPLASAAFGDQAASTVDTSRMELHELRILQGDAGSEGHSVSVTGAGVRAGAREVGATVATGGQHSVVGSDTVNGAILHVQANHTNAAIVLHDQVQSEVFNEIGGVEGQGAAVQGVKHRVSSAVRGSSAAVSLATLAKVQTLSAEGSLVDLALLGTRKGHSVTLQLQHRTRSLTTHVMDGVLVSEPVRALHGVVHVPSPVVLGHVAESSVDATLGSYGVRSGRKQLGHAGSLETSLSAAHGGSQTSATGTHHARIVLVVNDGVLGGKGSSKLSVRKLSGAERPNVNGAHGLLQWE
mmetsp:Transcript_33159/g.56727  ORF Transcript_33159/g.56727 Transcript_33159/m.56727 type:complete len:342 (+) Transcript_33159:1002-2027(+)